MVNIKIKVQLKGDSIERVTLFHSPKLSLEMNGTNRALQKWFEEYSKGKWTPFPLNIPITTFRDRVLRFLQTIPSGSVLSYQEVAKATGSPRAARAVGNICRGNPFPLLIPCHRVIKSNGEVGSYTPDPSLKTQLLQFEGIKIS